MKRCCLGKSQLGDTIACSWVVGKTSLIVKVIAGELYFQTCKFLFMQIYNKVELVICSLFLSGHLVLLIGASHGNVLHLGCVFIALAGHLLLSAIYYIVLEYFKVVCHIESLKTEGALEMKRKDHRIFSCFIIQCNISESLILILPSCPPVNCICHFYYSFMLTL